MAKVDVHGANADQIEFWNNEGAEKFIRHEKGLNKMIGPFGRAVMDTVGVNKGEFVLDIGCGTGDTTVELARRVGPKGEVIGVDISEPMLQRAEDLAAHNDMTNVFFEHADIQDDTLHRDSFDLAYSRFGSMFFAHPVKAFRNVRAMLHDNGRLGFVCWQSMKKNPWFLEPMMAAAKYVELPQQENPKAPGPFAFADPGYALGVLKESGFGELDIEPLEQEMILGGMADLDDAVEFAVQLGPLNELLEEETEKTRENVVQAVRKVLEKYHTEDGVRVTAAAFIISAKAA